MKPPRPELEIERGEKGKWLGFELLDLSKTCCFSAELVRVALNHWCRPGVRKMTGKGHGRLGSLNDLRGFRTAGEGI